MSIAVAEGFEGYPATWFYLDGEAGTLSETAPARKFAATDTVSVSIAPRFFNAPGRAFGATDQTQFFKQGKPSAYLKAQLAQDRAGTSTQPLTYAAMYPIIDSPDDDINSRFFSDPQDAPIVNVPLPGGSGLFRTPITAIVGGDNPKNSLLNIISHVLGIAASPGATALFPIPAADLALAANVESLIIAATTAFAPQTKQQFWIDDATIRVCANASSARDADSDVLQLSAGTTLFAVFPTGEGGAVEAAVKEIAKEPGTKFALDRGGTLIAQRGDTTVSPNPFADFLYVTYRATVAELRQPGP